MKNITIKWWSISKLVQDGLNHLDFSKATCISVLTFKLAAFISLTLWKWAVYFSFSLFFSVYFVSIIFAWSSFTDLSSWLHYFSSLAISRFYNNEGKYYFLFFLIGLDDSTHRVINATFVEIFVGFDLVAILVSDSYQKEPSLPAIDCYLSDDLIKTLIIQLLSGWTKSDLSGLSMDESLVKLLTELNDLYFGSWGGKDCLDPKLTVVCSMLFWRENLT